MSTWRDVRASALRADDEGRTVTVAGWVARRRDHGGLVFVDLRDDGGVLQVVINPANAPEAAALAHELRNEFVVQARGEIVLRAPETVNAGMATGEIELQAESLAILSRSTPLPFQLDEEGVDETLRLRYRWLDLRRDKMQRNLRMRAKLISIIRAEMEADGFIEIETPIMAKPTPEGARDFLVPSRLQPGRFFALPQSPQIYKQLLVISGFERYYQIARCFRDEDLRADRLQELTQLDVETAFPDREYLFGLIERTFARIWRELRGVEVETPFPRLTWEEATCGSAPTSPTSASDSRSRTRPRSHATRSSASSQRRGRPLLARAARAQPRRPREARGGRQAVGGEGARVPRLPGRRRGRLADRQVPGRARARALPERAGHDRPVRGGRAVDGLARARCAPAAPRPRARADRHRRASDFSG